jgi:hypothetical protein
VFEKANMMGVASSGGRIGHLGHVRRTFVTYLFDRVSNIIFVDRIKCLKMGDSGIFIRKVKCSILGFLTRVRGETSVLVTVNWFSSVSHT